MECRGHQKRIEIINKYYVTPIEHNIIVNGGYVEGDAGKNLNNEYYKFLIKNKNNPNDTDKIICGSHVAHDFAKLLNIKLPSVFNIFVNGNEDNDDNDKNDINNNNTIKWNAINKQLYNAIRIIMLKYDIAPNSILYKIYNDLIDNKDTININNIKGCNTILSRLNKKHPKTLTEILKEFATANPEKEIKQFQFDKLTNKLIECDVEHNKIYLK